MAMSSYKLSDEVTADVFSRLSVKDLLRLRCVSKSCRALIDDKYFVKKHLERSITESESNDNPSFLLIAEKGTLDKLYKVDVDYLLSRHRRVEIDQPLPSYFLRIVGTCNGLVCLSCFSTCDKRVAIWNPSTRESHELPAMPIKIIPSKSDKETVLFGFGHDPISDDYKVIGIVRRQGWVVSGTDDVKVYSLKTKSWSSLDFPRVNQFYFMGGDGIFARNRNAIHWVFRLKKPTTNNHNSYVIAAFNLGADIGYHEVQQPNYKSDDCINNFSLELGKLKGCLCIFTAYSSSSDLWIMKDEKEKKYSWTKLFSFSSTFPGWDDMKMPLVCSRNGNKLLVNDCYFCNVIWIDLKTKQTTYANLPEDLCLEEVLVETLVRVI